MSIEPVDVTVAGLRVSYRIAGEGPPLLLLHGYVGDGLGTWAHQLDDLSDEFTVVVWDAPGFGSSADPPDSFDLADFADCLAAFIGRVGLERPHVAGLSFGGGLAIQLYDRHPDLVASLVLVSAYAGWTGSLPPDAVGFRLRQALRLADLPGEELVREVLPTLFAPTAPKSLLDGFAKGMAEFHPAGLRATARSFAEADLRGVLPTIDVPTLLVYGSADVRAPLDVAKSIHSAIRGSSLVVIDGVGHVPNVESPERFNREVRTFLRSVTSARA
jgi:pimeloyl-ACP methyl ester carboxylesterase